MSRPSNIEVNLDEPVREFWKRRADAHTHDWYRGRTLAKMPEDLRTYQHIIEESKPEIILEIGSYEGGSAVWFADQLDVLVGRHLPRPTVISLDIRQIDYRGDNRIEFFRGSVTEESMARRIRPLLRGRRVMISEDSGHNRVTTTAALELYSDLVPAGCWLVVEDGIVDDPEVKLPRYRGGVQPSIEAFLASRQGKRFSRHWLQPYGLTTDIGGWLRAESMVEGT